MGVYRKTDPPWIREYDHERAAVDPNYVVRWRYYTKLFRAIPAWADPKAISAVYVECKRLRKLGRDVVVDHIVPLRSDYVCGLHDAANLQIITALENTLKSNIWWPDSPFEQWDLIGDFEPQQLRLA